MTRTPAFGPTDADTVRQAYEHGYTAFDHTDPGHLLPDDVDPSDVIADDDRALSDYESVRVAISESDANRRLWWGLEDYYSEHKSEEEETRFQREAAVAEDFDTAFSAGAYAALRGDDADPERDVGIFLPDADE